MARSYEVSSWDARCCHCLVRVWIGMQEVEGVTGFGRENSEGRSRSCIGVLRRDCRNQVVCRSWQWNCKVRFSLRNEVLEMGQGKRECGSVFMGAMLEVAQGLLFRLSRSHVSDCWG